MNATSPASFRPAAGATRSITTAGRPSSSRATSCTATTCGSLMRAACRAARTNSSSSSGARPAHGALITTSRSRCGSRPAYTSHPARPPSRARTS